MKVAVAIAAGAAMLGSLYAEPVRLAENGRAMAVLGKDHVPERRGHVFVYGITPVTAAHDVDRMGTVRLAK